MAMRHLAASLTATAVIATFSPASAAGPPYTVSVGGSSAGGTHPIHVASAGVVRFSARNQAGTVVHMNCHALTGGGTVRSGSEVNPVATLTSTTWTGCSIPGIQLTVTQSGPWGVLGTGANATSGTERIAGTITDVVAGVRATANPDACRFTLSGAPRSSFDEAAQQLVVHETGHTGALVLSDVVGCFGQLQNGNRADLSATLDVTSSAGALDLS